MVDQSDNSPSSKKENFNKNWNLFKDSPIINTSQFPACSFVEVLFSSPSSRKNPLLSTSTVEISTLCRGMFHPRIIYHNSQDTRLLQQYVCQCLNLSVQNNTMAREGGEEIWCRQRGMRLGFLLPSPFCISSLLVWRFEYASSFFFLFF